MGNDESKRQPSGEQTGELKIGHDRFKHFRYLQKDDLIEVTMEVDSEKEVREWESEAKRAMGFEDVETLLLSVRHEFEGRGFCGNVGTVKIYFENFPYLFSEEIDNRVSMEKHFEEEELWYLLYCLLSSAREFARNDSKIGDVRPYNIFINDEGQIKVASLLSWPHEKTNFEKTAFEKTPTYLAPEEVALIAQGTHENTTNKVVAESFSIGLTMLQAGLLFDASQLYLSDKSFDSAKLANILNDWMALQFATDQSETQGYSDLLKAIVWSLCDPDPHSRTSSLHFEELLRPHLNEILHLKPFDHKSVKFSIPNTQPSQQPLKLQAQPPPQQKPFEQVYISAPSYQTQVFNQRTNFAPQGYTQNYQQPPLSQPQSTFAQQPFPQQQVFLQQQTYRVAPLEPKMNQLPEPSPRTFDFPDSGRVGSNPQSVRFNPQVVTEQEVRYYTAPGEPRGQGYQEFFNRYASGQPEPPRPQPQPQPQSQPNYNPNFTVPSNFNPPNGNTFNIPSGFNPTYPSPPLSNPPFSPPLAVTATSQYSYSGIPVQPKAGGAESSDFLKKIDEQLQNSRRQFPS